MRRPIELALTALVFLAAIGCMKSPEPRIAVQVRSNPDDAALTMKGKAIGKAPQAIKVVSTADLMNLAASRGTELAVEKRIRFVDAEQAEVTFVFGEGSSPMAKALGLPRILVFDFGSAFDIGKSDIKPQFAPLLERQAEMLKTLFAGQDVYVCGHTDKVGQKESNLNLSMDRAQRVTNELVKMGVPKEKIKIKGFGAAIPVATNDTPEGRALNRRTEIILGQ